MKKNDESRRCATLDGREAEEAIPERFQALAERLARDAWTIAKGDIDRAVTAVRAQADEEIAEARSEAEAAGHTVDALQGTLEELRAELERVHGARREQGRSGACVRRKSETRRDGASRR